MNTHTLKLTQEQLNHLYAMFVNIVYQNELQEEKAKNTIQGLMKGTIEIHKIDNEILELIKQLPYESNELLDE